MMIVRRYLLLVSGLLLMMCNSRQPNDLTIKQKRFEKELIRLRKEYNVPSVAAAIVSDKQIIYAEAFGYADVEQQIAATDSTPYRIASITKPIASTIILRLTERGLIDIDSRMKDCWGGYTGYFDMVSRWIKNNAPQMKGLIENYYYRSEAITVRHHLTHTSEGVPGTRFSYSGFLYSCLSNVVDAVSERDFYTLVKNDIIIDLGMTHSLPQQSDTWRPEVGERLARPYTKNGDKELVPGVYPDPDLGAGAGIVSTVTDLAIFDIALDNGDLLSSEMKHLAFTPATLNSGEAIPYGLGWFIGTYNDTKVVYHTGWQPAAFSGLYLKVPDKALTLILLANSEDLIAPFMQGLGAGNIDSSPFAKVFLDTFLD